MQNLLKQNNVDGEKLRNEKWRIIPVQNKVEPMFTEKSKSKYQLENELQKDRKPGPNCKYFNPGMSPGDVFKTILNDVIIYVVTEINATLERTHPNYHFGTVTVDYFYAWIGVWLQTMLNPRTSITKFWSKNKSTQPDTFIKKIFSNRDMCMNVYQALFHLSDEFLMNLELRVITILPKYYKSFPNISIDEMLKYKGK